jgi:hypothetical protein
MDGLDIRQDCKNGVSNLTAGRGGHSCDIYSYISPGYIYVWGQASAGELGQLGVVVAYVQRSNTLSMAVIRAHALGAQ